MEFSELAEKLFSTGVFPNETELREVINTRLTRATATTKLHTQALLNAIGRVAAKRNKEVRLRALIALCAMVGNSKGYKKAKKK